MTVFEQNKENIDELIASFFSRGTNPEEEKLLLEWIESDANNEKYYKQMYKAWLSSAQNNQLVSVREEYALKQVHKKAFDISAFEKRLQAQKVRKLMFHNFFKYAGIITLLIIGTHIITRHFSNQKPSTYVNEMIYEAHYGSRAYAVLPDGSKVWLNSGSKLIILSGYNIHDREVKLTGEAFFDVETDIEKPFIVQVGELSVKATGTAFNIKAYPEEEQITTTLVEGTVFVKGLSDQKKEFELKMNPKQSVSYWRQGGDISEEKEYIDTINSAVELKIEETNNNILSSPTIINHVNTEALTSWMKNRWIIDNEDFGSLAIQLERRYNVEIRFESEKLKEYYFTGTIERETVEQMFDAFRYSIPLKYVIDKGIVTITLDKDLEKLYEKAWKP